MELKVGMKFYSEVSDITVEVIVIGTQEVMFKNVMFSMKAAFSVLKKDVNEYLSEFKLVEEPKTDPIVESVINTPSHYDNSKGTLYKVAQERGWNAYLFDIVKRLERAEKKGVFDEDLDKSIAVIQLWKKERNEYK